MTMNGTVAKRPVVLEATGLRKTFGGLEVLRCVDLCLRKGEVVLLRGANGAGKTTLINILTGHLKPDKGKITASANGSARQFLFPETFLTRINPLREFLPEQMAGRGVMRTWQDTRLFPSLNLKENVAVAAPNNPAQNPLNALFKSGRVKVFEEKSLQNASGLLANVQLGDREQSSGGALSLGQEKRVAIAATVNAGARVLFFDEPLAGLDHHGIETMIDMLRALSASNGISIVVVEHQLYSPFILSIADTVWDLEGGRLHVLQSKNVDLVEAATGVQAVEPMLENAGWEEARRVSLPKDARLVVFRKVGFKPDAQPLLELRNLAVKRGKRWIIGQAEEGHDSGELSFEVHKGDLVLLYAPNGWGKTTVLDAIAGIAAVARGEIRFGGEILNSLPAWDRAQRGLDYLRARDNIFPSLTVNEQFSLSEASEDLVQNLWNRKMGTLSGGERQKVKIAECLRGFSLLDEPFTGLDNENLSRVVDELSKIDGAIVALPSTEALEGGLQ